MVDGIDVKAEEFEAAGKHTCELCVQAKQTRLPLPSSTSTSSLLMDDQVRSVHASDFAVFHKSCTTELYVHWNTNVCIW
jgi:hypothetical protein